MPQPRETKLTCGPCGHTVLAIMAHDCMRHMVRHWCMAHYSLSVPEFNQDTWRNGVVRELGYTPEPLTRGYLLGYNPPATFNADRSTPKPVMTHERVQVMVREIHGWNKRTKVRYQTYVKLPTADKNLYMPITDSLADARAQRDTLHAMLVHTMSGDTVIEVLDYI